MKLEDLIDLAGLCARWKVCRSTARQYTRAAGFPAPLVLSARHMLWPVGEVSAWEQERRTKPARKPVKLRPMPTTVTPKIRRIA